MCYFKETIRFAVLALGIIYLLSGAALISIGAIYNVTFNDLSKAIPNSYKRLHYIPALTISDGALIASLSVFGYIAIFCKKYKLLIIYSNLLTAVALFQVATGIFTILAVSDHEDFSKNINKTVEAIFQNRNEVEFIVLVQRQFHCCGTYGPSYWDKIQNLPLPESCCSDDSCFKVYENGCQSAIFDFFMEALNVVGVTVLLFAISEIAGALLSLFLAKETKIRGRGYHSAHNEDY